MLRILLDLQVLQSVSRDREIGNYSRGLVDALLRRNDAEWHILFSDAMPDTLLPALRWARERIEPKRIHVLHGLRPICGLDADNAGRARSAEALYTGFVEALAVDLVHVASPFEGWSDETTVEIAPSGGRTAFAATVYDLIPFEKPDLFPPTASASAWYQRRLDGLARADTALAISEHTCRIARARLGLPEDAVVNIGTDADPIFAPRSITSSAAEAIRDRYGLAGPFLVHVGNPEPHKNVHRLIEAFAALPESVRTDHQLLLVTPITDAQRENVTALTRSLGLPPQAVLMPGFIPGAELADLYNLAAVTVQPSLDESFALPLLEAMRCGCPVLGSDMAGIPEVIGRADLTFDPTSPPAMTRSLERILIDPDFRAGACAHAAKQQSRFSWDESAARACAAFEAALSRRGATARPTCIVRSLDLHGLGAGRYRLPIAPYLDGGTQAHAVPLPDDATTEGSLSAEGPVLLIDLEMGADMHVHGPVEILSFDAVATLRPTGQDDVREAWTLTWHSWPRSRTCAPSALICASPEEALTRVLDDHPLAQVIEPVARLRRLLAEAPHAPDAPFALARALAENHAPARARQRLLVDVTELARSDARSGIQRVVRNILGALLAEPDGFEVLAIRREGVGYHFARIFTAGFMREPLRDRDTPVDFRPGDTVLGLDMDLKIPQDAVADLQRHHLRGVRFVHVLYDTLPVHRPDWFWDGVGTLYTQWLHVLAELSDGIACISRAVSDDLAEIFAERDILMERTVTLGAFHLGADLDAARRTQAAGRTPSATHEPGISSRPQTAEPLFEPGVPVFLTVGTLEPRKGYVQLLDAAEILWAKGSPLILAIVGKRGWLVDTLIARIETHPELGRRLRWFEAVDDGVLQQIYQQATVALLPSEGEGFGLPLIEAAHVGLPILARDLPVFREIGGAHATYFSGSSGPALARAMAGWLKAHATGRAPSSAGITPLTWADSARQLLAFLHTVPHQP